MTLPPCPPAVIPDCFTFDIGVSLIKPPFGPFGARETRVSRVIPHPAGHSDIYVTVVGALLGTTPGPLFGPRFVIIHGSVGVHAASTTARALAGALTPPSDQPSQPDLDYPSGQMIAVADPTTNRITMLLVVDSVLGQDVNQVIVRDGFNGPVVADLRPQMQTHEYDPHATALIAGDAFVPVPAMQAIMSGHATLSVPVLDHPDGQIVGQVTLLACDGDTNGDGVVNVVDLVAVILDWGTNGAAHGGDVTGDGIVNVLDLLEVILNWGACF